ncbi:hypothetical protein BX257_4756 [Streptomyces sp. 3212.3]|uniref:hypothetical protein n=1 Tax=Streptomyces sp. 3212.3 TaxID=1938846 RepID=UPI000E26F978|nr:hypothetical protein [Streptomyces sp. 3212.3]REE62143.1 hypothetical protein BX257_4756 [Streptomyces sp. 3212.3]
MVDRADRPAGSRKQPRSPETFEEIAERLGRPVSTVRNTWSRHPAWPQPLEERRGRWKLFDPEAVDAFIRDHLERDTPALEPRRLYTARELEDAGLGITAGTIRAYLTRGRWPAPDDTQGGVNRWYGATVTQALEHRRAYRRGPGA